MRVQLWAMLSLVLCCTVTDSQTAVQHWASAHGPHAYSTVQGPWQGSPTVQESTTKVLTPLKTCARVVTAVCPDQLLNQPDS